MNKFIKKKKKKKKKKKQLLTVLWSWVKDGKKINKNNVEIKKKKKKQTNKKLQTNKKVLYLLYKPQVLIAE